MDTPLHSVFSPLLLLLARPTKYVVCKNEEGKCSTSKTPISPCSNEIESLKELVIMQANSLKILSDQVSTLHQTVNKIGSMLVESNTFGTGIQQNNPPDNWVLSVKNDI